MAVDAVAILIPAYNESRGLGDRLRELHDVAIQIGAALVVIDDGSDDETANVARAAGARVIRHRRNRGYGAALKTGICSVDTEYVLTVDADGQHRPEDVEKIWARRGDADLIVGARKRLIHSPFWRMPGKWALGWLAQVLVGRRIPDLNSGLRVVRRRAALRYLHVCPDGYSFSTTITMAFLSRGYVVDFHQIEVRERVGTSAVTLKTGFAATMLVLRLACLFGPLRLFLGLAGGCFVAGLAWGAPYVYLGRGVSIGALLLFLTGVIMFALGLLADQVSTLRLERFEGLSEEFSSTQGDGADG